jgi:hypothetical protein
VIRFLLVAFIGPSAAYSSYPIAWPSLSEKLHAGIEGVRQRAELRQVCRALGRRRDVFSDGQHFKAGRNAKYGNEPGALFCTYISDQYAPFHTIAHFSDDVLRLAVSIQQVLVTASLILRKISASANRQFAGGPDRFQKNPMVLPRNLPILPFVEGWWLFDFPRRRCLSAADHVAQGGIEGGRIHRGHGLELEFRMSTQQ